MRKGFEDLGKICGVFVKEMARLATERGICTNFGCNYRVNGMHLAERCVRI
jgi:hypothetical protein